jgi:hypothetical protein
MKITILENINSICVEDMTDEQFNFILDAVMSVTTKDTESEDDF